MINDIATRPWSNVALHKLSNAEMIQLQEDSRLFVQRGMEPSRSEHQLHHHPRPQALLVLRGSMTHHSNGDSYTQGPGDLLIVPAHWPHSAKVGEEGVEYLFIQKAFE